MKKILGLAVLMASVTSLTACGGLPTCNDELDNCNRDAAYTEERTAKARQKIVVATPVPVIEEVEAPVIEKPEPAPVPVVIDDAPVMQSAEPMVQHISK